MKIKLLLFFFAFLLPNYSFGLEPEKVLKKCKNSHITPENIKIVQELLKIEIKFGLPKNVRGLILGAACAESGFREHPGYGDQGRSAGMFQFMRWAKKYIKNAKTKDPRLDWRASAEFWLKHVIKQYPKVKKYCKGRGGYKTRELYLWASANTTAVRFPKCKCLKKDQYGNCSKYHRNKAGYIQIITS